MRVVIVDDDETLLRAMEECVATAGHDVASFTEFEDAKRYLATARFDVLVTDVRLGPFNGLQLAMLARRESPQANVIVLSGFDDAVLRTDAAGLGALFYLKPVSGRELLAGIDGVSSRESDDA